MHPVDLDSVWYLNLSGLYYGMVMKKRPQSGGRMF